MLSITHWRAERLSRPQLVANEGYGGAKDLHCLGCFVRRRRPEVGFPETTML